jgi:RimJ/RimL family protein N-acetyltransferase
VGPCTLDGRFVRLVPLRYAHAEALLEAGGSTDWEWFLGPLRSKEAVIKRIEDGLKGEDRDQQYAFAVVLKSGTRVVGSTAYLSVVSEHRRLEIGSTWYSRDVWGTVVNPECKLLLMEHAFEDWGAVRVEFRTDENNVRSQRAILKLGAKFEGACRKHGIRPDGSVRNVFLYSIIDSEWPEVRTGLLARTSSFGPG